VRGKANVQATIVITSSAIPAMLAVSTRFMIVASSGDNDLPRTGTLIRRTRRITCPKTASALIAARIVRRRPATSASAPATAIAASARATASGSAATEASQRQQAYNDDANNRFHRDSFQQHFGCSSPTTGILALNIVETLAGSV
jgi:hypothetical protein